MLQRAAVLAYMLITIVGVDKEVPVLRKDERAGDGRGWESNLLRMSHGEDLTIVILHRTGDFIS